MLKTSWVHFRASFQTEDFSRRDLCMCPRHALLKSSFEPVYLPLFLCTIKYKTIHFLQDCLSLIWWNFFWGTQIVFSSSLLLFSTTSYTCFFGLDSVSGFSLISLFLLWKKNIFFVIIVRSTPLAYAFLFLFFQAIKKGTQFFI